MQYNIPANDVSCLIQCNISRSCTINYNKTKINSINNNIVYLR